MKRRNFLKALGGSFTLLKPAGAGASAMTKPLELTREGQSMYAIGISRDASASEKHGSQELQRFLEEMSGASLPIITDAQKASGNLVLVGNSDFLDSLRQRIDFESLGMEGFALKTAGRSLVIAGGRQRGTMYGVYTFLDKLGCRWVARDASRIPKMPTITVPPLDEVQKPAFEYRDVYIGEAFDKDWAARNKTNGTDTHLDASTGGKVVRLAHSFYSLIPPAEYFKSHPEYFSLVDGKRRGEDAQLCLTNPDMLRIATEHVLRWMKERPEATIF